MDKKVCVYAICKNESKFIDQWLDSMAEADYIAVLDTGSTDDTLERLLNDPRVTVVEQEIISPWRFDVARNKSMELVPADADILVCTDFDEWFEPGWCAAIKENWRDDITRIHYQYAWSHNDLGEPGDVFMYDKIHTRDYHWIYPVHEVLWPNNDDFEDRYVEVFDTIYLHHFQDLSKPRGNYLDLLKLSAEENPEDCHVSMLLAREYLLNNNADEALRQYLKSLQMPEIEEKRMIQVKLETLGRIADIYLEQDDYANCEKYCFEFLKVDDTYREPYLILANCFNRQKLFALTESIINLMLDRTNQKFSWVERANSWSTEYNDALAISQYNQGKIDEAIKNGRIAYEHNPNNLRLAKNLLAYYKQKEELQSN